MEQGLRERDAIMDDLRFHFIKAQQRMKKWADMKRCECSFMVGELVFV